MKNEKLKLINLKVGPKELKQLKKLAKKYADGNLSAWLRFAGINFKQSKKVNRTFE